MNGKVELNSIEPLHYYENGTLVTGFSTPMGRITARQRSIGFGAMPGPEKYLLSERELEIFYYVLKHAKVRRRPLQEYHRHELELLGDRGILAVTLGMTPFKWMLETYAGLENTYCLIADAPELFDEVMDLMMRRQLENTECILQHSCSDMPAEVFYHAENTSSTTESPAVYERYCAPQTEAFSSLIHGFEKVYLIHMCGKLKALKTQIAHGSCDGILDIAPEPTGDTSLDEAASMFPDKAVSGGLGCGLFSAASPEAAYETVQSLLRRFPRRRGVILGSGDSVPYGADPGTFQAIRAALMREEADR